jgi:hypothetical protein
MEVVKHDDMEMPTIFLKYDWVKTGTANAVASDN